MNEKRESVPKKNETYTQHKSIHVDYDVDDNNENHNTAVHMTVSREKKTKLSNSSYVSYVYICIMHAQMRLHDPKHIDQNQNNNTTVILLLPCWSICQCGNIVYLSPFHILYHTPSKSTE